jgi:hypothetical protein
MATSTRRDTCLDPRRARRAREHFLEYFPDGFTDETYLETERAFKWEAHRQWQTHLSRDELTALVRVGAHSEVARRAVRIESRTSLLFSFEKMAVRDAVSTRAGARAFATGLAAWLHGPGSERERFQAWCATVAELPRFQTRVATWPVVTVFGFIARPRVHLMLKPTVAKRAAEACGFPLRYASRPQWDTYSSLLEFARAVRDDLRPMRPRDMIDIQSFLWVQGSDEYP